MNFWFKLSRALVRLAIIVSTFFIGGWFATQKPAFSWGVAAAVAVAVTIGGFFLWCLGCKSTMDDSETKAKEETKKE